MDGGGGRAEEQRTEVGGQTGTGELATEDSFNFRVATVPSYVFNVPLGLIRNSQLCGPAQFHRWQG